MGDINVRVVRPKLRVNWLEEKKVTRKFQSELSVRFKKRRCKVGEEV